MKRLPLTLALILGAGPAVAADNYSATAGSGLTFAAKDNGSGVLFSRFIGCDNTTTTQCWVVDASGRLTVNLATGSTIAVTQATAASLNATVVGTGTFAAQINGFTSWAGGTLGAMANYGTSPGAVLVPGVNAFITNTNANVATNIDGVAGVGAGTTGAGSPVNSYVYNWNGSTFDRQYKSAGATAAAPPSGATYLGANASGATGGQMRGLINCDNHVFKHITSATDTLAVQGVASQTIYVCGWRSRAAGVATWFLENTASTNANCSSANTQITGVATEAANTGEVNNNPIWGGLKNTSANGLCINSTGTGGVDVDIWYTQF